MNTLGHRLAEHVTSNQMEASRDEKMAQASAQTDLENNLVCTLFPTRVNGAGLSGPNR
jgi:hypothetical protein